MFQINFNITSYYCFLEKKGNGKKIPKQLMSRDNRYKIRDLLFAKKFLSGFCMIKNIQYNDKNDKKRSYNNCFHNSYFLSLIKYKPAKKQTKTIHEPTINITHFLSKLPKKEDIRIAVATYLAMSINHFPISFLIVKQIYNTKVVKVFELTNDFQFYSFAIP